MAIKYLFISRVTCFHELAGGGGPASENKIWVKLSERIAIEFVVWFDFWAPGTMKLLFPRNQSEKMLKNQI